MSAFSHLGWGGTGNDCPPHPLILHHMLLHSQQNHILHHTTTSLFPRPSCWSSPPTLTSPTSTNTPHSALSKPFQSFLPQLNRKVFNSKHLCHLTARLLILTPHSCHVSQHPVITSTNLLVSYFDSATKSSA